MTCMYPQSQVMTNTCCDWWFGGSGAGVTGPSSARKGKAAYVADLAAWAEVGWQCMKTSVVDQDDVLRWSFATAQEVHSMEQHCDLGLLARIHGHNYGHARPGERPEFPRVHPAEAYTPKGVRKGHQSGVSIALLYDFVR